MSDYTNTRVQKSTHASQITNIPAGTQTCTLTIFQYDAMLAHPFYGNVSYLAFTNHSLYSAGLPAFLFSPQSLEIHFVFCCGNTKVLVNMYECVCVCKNRSLLRAYLF